MVIAVAIVFTHCQRDKPNSFKSTASFHNFIDFKHLSRAEQVKACAKCHASIYENEMNGPHANAYRNLIQHKEYIGRKEYDCAPYCAQVNDALPGCVKCHSGANLFETVFKNAGSPGEVVRGISAGINYDVLPRDTATLITGVDCITCHYNGQNVVTQTAFVKTKGGTACPDFCSPVPSQLFASNLSCYPCHQEQVVTMQGYPLTAVTCNTCHGERDKTGKTTHYTYWAHNPADKAFPARLGIFSSIDAVLSKPAGGINVTWRNNTLPHVRSVCTELVAVVEVTSNGKFVTADTIRINRKTEHDKQMSGWFKDLPVPGSTGTEFTKLNDSITRFIALPPTKLAGRFTVNITGYKKEQYWLHDSVNTIYAKKSIVL